MSDVDVCGAIPQIFKNIVAEWQAAMPKQIEKVLTVKPEEQQKKNDDKED